MKLRLSWPRQKEFGKCLIVDIDTLFAIKFFKYGIYLWIAYFGTLYKHHEIRLRLFPWNFEYIHWENPEKDS